MNFIKRLAAPTPAEEKRIQVICLLLEGVDAWLHNLGYIPTMIAVIVGSILAGAAIVAQYAVELVPEIEATIQDPTLPKIMATLEDLASKFEGVQGAVTSFNLPDPTVALNAVLDAIKNAAPAPVINVVSSDKTAPIAEAEPAPVAEAAPAPAVEAEPAPIVQAEPAPQAGGGVLDQISQVINS